MTNTDLKIVDQCAFLNEIMKFVIFVLQHMLENVVSFMTFSRLCLLARVGFVVCREPGRISLYVALPPSRPQPIGSHKQLERRSRSAVHRDENFAS